MDNNITIILELLSAGVIAALVAGIFSLAIAIKNNKRLVDLENIKQKFTINQERYKALKEAYDELLAKLPEKNLLNHIIINLPAQNEFQKKDFFEIYNAAEENMEIMYSHFQKYSYLFSDNEQQKINNLIEEIDAIAKNIIKISLDLQINDFEKKEDDFAKEIYIKNIERIEKVAELEKVYYELFKNSLSKLSK